MLNEEPVENEEILEDFEAAPCQEIIQGNRDIIRKHILLI